MSRTELELGASQVVTFIPAVAQSWLTSVNILAKGVCGSCRCAVTSQEEVKREGNVANCVAESLKRKCLV